MQRDIFSVYFDGSSVEGYCCEVLRSMRAWGEASQLYVLHTTPIIISNQIAEVFGTGP